MSKKKSCVECGRTDVKLTLYEEAVYGGEPAYICAFCKKKKAKEERELEKESDKERIKRLEKQVEDMEYYIMKVEGDNDAMERTVEIAEALMETKKFPAPTKAMDDEIKQALKEITDFIADVESRYNPKPRIVPPRIDVYIANEDDKIIGGYRDVNTHRGISGELIRMAEETYQRNKEIKREEKKEQEK